ncbi:MAG: Lipid A export ATP-binding/permease protein MsbA, partial [uncultured Phycisphaerae bacterium]
EFVPPRRGLFSPRPAPGGRLGPADRPVDRPGPARGLADGDPGRQRARLGREPGRDPPRVLRRAAGRAARADPGAGGDRPGHQARAGRARRVSVDRLQPGQLQRPDARAVRLVPQAPGAEPRLPPRPAAGRRDLPAQVRRDRVPDGPQRDRHHRGRRGHAGRDDLRPVDAQRQPDRAGVLDPAGAGGGERRVRPAAQGAVARVQGARQPVHDRRPAVDGLHRPRAGVRPRERGVRPVPRHRARERPRLVAAQPPAGRLQHDRRHAVRPRRRRGVRLRRLPRAPGPAVDRRPDGLHRLPRHALGAAVHADRLQRQRPERRDQRPARLRDPRPRPRHRRRARRGPPPAPPAGARARPRQLQLRPAAGAERRLGPRRARADGGVRRRQRRGQEHPAEPPAAVLRPVRGRGAPRRGRRPPGPREGPPPPRRARAPGQRDPADDDRGEHRLRPARGDARAGPRRGRHGRRRRVHRRAAGRLRHAHHRGRPEPLGRPAAAHLDRAGAADRGPVRRPRRADQRARPPPRAGRDRRPARAKGHAHDRDRQPPAQQRARLRPDLHDGARPRGRAGHARRTRGAARRLLRDGAPPTPTRRARPRLREGRV